MFVCIFPWFPLGFEEAKESGKVANKGEACDKENHHQVIMGLHTP